MARTQQQPEAYDPAEGKAEAFGGSLVRDQGHIHFCDREHGKDLGQILVA